MKSLIVALPNDNDLASELGKKGSQNGITFYNRKSEGTTIVVLAPTDVGSKFYAVGEIMSIADIAVISTKSLDSAFGESVIAASLLGKKVLFTTGNDIGAILKSMAPMNYEMVDRRELLNRLTSFERDPSKDSAELRIDIDKSFPVKGVGTVLLGVVRSGRVKVHDTLRASNGKEVLVRSIQVQDDNFEEAGVGSRVGLAVKGVEENDIGKGDALSKNAIPYVSSFLAEIKKSPLAKETEIDNVNCTLISYFSVVNCKITKKENGFEIRLEKPTALSKKDDFVLIKERAPRVFASGRVVETG